ncbi:MAG: DHHA1 domain-containing protein [Chloroflexota bacterium]
MPMTTKRLYYDNSYTLNFEANVVEHTTYKDPPAVVLDQTYFYPEGGGQPHDTGVINGVRVIDVQTRDADRAVLHVLASPITDSRVAGQIDAARRTDYMQHHSGQHILSQALSQAAEAETVSVHMSADSMTIDVKRINITPDEWIAVEDLANRIVLENRRVRVWFPEPDELASLRLRKLPDVAGKVRVVDMGGFDVTACGGTHVGYTGEIGAIKVVRFERRGDTTRLEFKCGGRALRDYRDKNDLINRLVTDLTVAYRDVPETIQRLQAENKTLRNELKAAREQLIEAEAAALLPTASHIGSVRIVTHAYEGRDVNDLKLLAQKLAAQPATIALIGLAGEKGQLLFGRAEDVAVDMASLLKGALALLNSDRGGGRANFAQGGGVPASLAQVTAALQQAERSILTILAGR